ncbi:sulfate adenylyltransferase subunit 1 [Streptomyces griseostramineus]|uniref:Sulfate adenylyltransferase subunit 1 n=1 Tax=Streptomyces griseomycini TaxID=66895 RepID=A0A7W7PQN7_9ACTN|nr:sulfate adenylyltransferase subunit 1 [Streptomyces griseomycini]
MGLLSMRPTDYYGTFAKEGGRVGSGALGSGQGGVARCAR